MRLLPAWLTVWRLMASLVVCVWGLALFSADGMLIVLTILLTAVFGGPVLAVRAERARGGSGWASGLSTLAAAGVFALLVLSSTQTTIGQKSAVVGFLVVDGGTGRPIPGAEVEIRDPREDYINGTDSSDTPSNRHLPVRGRTAADGRVQLRGWFWFYGMQCVFLSTDRVSFNPRVVRVNSGGYAEFRAPLGNAPVDIPGWQPTAPPLNLSAPVRRAVRVALVPKRESGGG